MADTATAQEYKIVITGEDGSGDQVFTANSPEELNQKLKSAQENASRKIREQATRIKELEAEAVPAPQVQVNTSGDKFDQSVYLTLLQRSGAEAFAYAAKFAEAWPKEIQEDYQVVRESSLNSRRQAVNATFARKHPELLQVTPEDDVKNSTAISKILVELYPELANNNGVYSEKQLEAAFNQAKAEGLLKLPEGQTTQIVTQEATPAVVVPTVITNATATQPVNTEEDFRSWAMRPDVTRAQVEAEIQKRAQARQSVSR